MTVEQTCEGMEAAASAETGQHGALGMCAAASRFKILTSCVGVRTSRVSDVTFLERHRTQHSNKLQGIGTKNGKSWHLLLVASSPHLSVFVSSGS